MSICISVPALVFFVAIAAAVIEAALRRDDAVYLHLGGQEEPNWLTMIMLWLIRLRARIFSADYTELDKRDKVRVGKKDSNQAKGALLKQPDYLIWFI